MCGRYSLATPHPGVVRERFGLAADTVVEQRFNIAPGQHALAVTTDREGTPRPDSLRWGLVPFWADDPKIAWRMINARSETAFEKPAFRDALERRRCLVVADGFFEWQPLGGKLKQPWWMTLPEHEPFAFAGLWATWRPKGRDDVEPLRTFTILTTEASPSLREVHDRMPVLVPRDAEAAWLDPATPAPVVADLLVPFDGMVRVPVGPRVSDPANDDPSVIEPVELAPAGEQTLF
jgi:putative SOS response-associated peptidase YedK